MALALGRCACTALARGSAHQEEILQARPTMPFHGAATRPMPAAATSPTQAMIRSRGYGWCIHEVRPWPKSSDASPRSYAAAASAPRRGEGLAMAIPIGPRHATLPESLEALEVGNPVDP